MSALWVALDQICLKVDPAKASEFLQIATAKVKELG